MASSDNQWHGLSGAFANNTQAHVQWWTNSTNPAARQTSVHLRLYLWVGGSGTGLQWSTGQARSGTFYINGVSRGSGTPPGDAYRNNTYVYFDTDVTLTHDTNGNWSGTFGGAVSYSFASVGSGSGTWNMTLDRLVYPPQGVAISASNISVVTATLTASASNNGNGTSRTYELSYRASGAGSWTTISWTGTAAHNLTGLIPGTTYEFRARARNNNNDTSGYTATQEFTTLPAPSTSQPLLKIIGVL